MFNNIKKSRCITIVTEPIFFIKIVLVLMLLISFPYIGILTQKIMKIIPIWAAIILLLNANSFKAIIRKDFYWILILFGVSYAITVVLNREYNVMQNTKSLIWFIIYIGILMSGWQFKEINKKKAKENIWQINWIVIIINLLNVVPSIFLFVVNICISFQDRPIGIYTGRLFGVMAGINPSAMVALVSIMTTLMNIEIKKENNKFVYSIYGINIVLSYIFIIASGTRSVRLIMEFLMGFMGFVYLWKKWLLSKTFNGNFISAVCSILCGGLILTVSYLGVEASRYPIGMIPMLGKSIGFVNIYENAEKWDNAEHTDTDSTEYKDHIFENAVIRDKESGERSSSHRMNIAKECFLLWREAPIFGIGSANMNEYASRSDVAYKYIINPPYGVSTHSMPIAALLFSGLCGLFWISIYLVLKMLKSVILLLKRESIVGRLEINILLPIMICMSLCIYSLAGTIIVFSNVECTILFWIYWGILGETE